MRTVETQRIEKEGEEDREKINVCTYHHHRRLCHLLRPLQTHCHRWDYHLLPLSMDSVNAAHYAHWARQHYSVRSQILRDWEQGFDRVVKLWANDLATSHPIHCHALLHPFRLVIWKWQLNYTSKSLFISSVFPIISFQNVTIKWRFTNLFSQLNVF